MKKLLLITLLTLGFAQNNFEWNQTFGGSNRDAGYDVKQTYDGDIEIEFHNSSSNNFLASDNIPKFGVRTEHCTINGGGYWTGSIALKFVVESDF